MRSVVTVEITAMGCGGSIDARRGAEKVRVFKSIRGC